MRSQQSMKMGRVGTKGRTTASSEKEGRKRRSCKKLEEQWKVWGKKKRASWKPKERKFEEEC